jgi:hypothetical protein
MKKQPEAVTRENILDILSAEEAALVGLVATAAQIASGDEFIDLADIAKGVQRAGEPRPQKDVLPRKAISENTWRKIVTNLTARQAMAHVPAPPPKLR